MVTLRHENGDEETVVEWSLRHFQLRHMGYKEIEINIMSMERSYE